MTTWERGERAFYDRYFLGKIMQSKEMDFGKKIASGLEAEETKDKEVEFCRMWLPTAKKQEKEFEIIVKIEEIPLLVKMDRFAEEEKLIEEYKTGKVKWTQRKADEHGQITIYDMAVHKKYGFIPDNNLHWIPTKEEGEKIVLTGDLPQCFKTKRTLADFASMYGRMKRAWKGINSFCESL
jgi:hypothetical protein